MMETFHICTNMVATSHVWPWSACKEARETGGLNVFQFLKS